jgi:PilZ domain
MSKINYAPVGEAFMAGVQLERREAKREFVQLNVRIQVQTRDLGWHAALVRDVSSEGMFFYSDFWPSPGDPIKFRLKFTDRVNGIPIWYTGKVVRVKEVQAGPAVGIAVSLEHCDFINQNPL